MDANDCDDDFVLICEKASVPEIRSGGASTYQSETATSIASSAVRRAQTTANKSVKVMTHWKFFFRK